jgi:hypothetical protein
LSDYECERPPLQLNNLPAGINTFFWKAGFQAAATQSLSNLKSQRILSDAGRTCRDGLFILSCRTKFTVESGGGFQTSPALTLPL